MKAVMLPISCICQFCWRIEQSSKAKYLIFFPLAFVVTAIWIHNLSFSVLLTVQNLSHIGCLTLWVIYLSDLNQIFSILTTGEIHNVRFRVFWSFGVFFNDFIIFLIFIYLIIFIKWFLNVLIIWLFLNFQNYRIYITIYQPLSPITFCHSTRILYKYQRFPIIFHSLFIVRWLYLCNSGIRLWIKNIMSTLQKRWWKML